MTLTYEPTLEDLSEPSIRFYLRSGTAASSRWKSAAISGFLSAVLAYALVQARRPDLAVKAAFTAGALTAMLNGLLFLPGVRRRIRKYVSKQVSALMPLKTTYNIHNDSLHCETAGVTTTFSLSDLSEISEDEKRLEIAFGPKGLCVLPLRAFRSPAEKEAFIAAIRGGGA
jgi:hypothetical protein